MIVGKDSDLFFLSTLRVQYNFIWYKDFTVVYKKTVISDTAVDISLMRLFIAKHMGAVDEENNIVPDLAVQCIRDFILFAFLIGDDFVPGSFCFDIHAGIALDIMMEKYKNLNLPLTIKKNDDLLINLDNFKEFLKEVKALERDLYETKKRTQELENEKKSCKKEQTNFPREQELLNSRRVLSVDKPSFEFLNSKFLEFETFEEFQDAWERNVVCPNYIRLASKSDRKLLNSLKNWNEEFQDACREFLVGLQWNLSYYYGFINLSDWSYSWCYAPTIKHLYDYIKTCGCKRISEHIDNDREEQTATEVLFTIFNIHKTRKFLQSYTGKKNSKKPIDVVSLLKCSRILEAYHPINFLKILEGKYVRVEKDRKTGKIKEEKLFGHTAILPFIPREFQKTITPIKIIEDSVCFKHTNGLDKEKRKYGEIGEFDIQNLERCSFISKIFERKVGFGKDSIRIFKDEEQNKRDGNKELSKGKSKNFKNPRNDKQDGRNTEKSKNRKEEITDILI